MKIQCYDMRERKVLFDLPEDGVLTPQVRWVLMNGHCHSFALAVHKLTNWPIVAKRSSNAIIHLYCRKRDPLALVDAGSTIILRRLPRAFRLLRSDYRFVESDGWVKPEIDAVIPFAESRLKEIEREGGTGCYSQEYPFLENG